MILNHFPKTTCVWEGGHTFKHDLCAAQCQRTISNVSVASDPTDVSGAPKHIVVFQVKRPFGGERGMHQITTGAVLHAFGFAGRARGVEQEERVLSFYPLWGTGGGLLVRQFRQPQVAARLHGHFCT